MVLYSLLHCLTYILVLKQEDEACGIISGEPNSNCGECNEGLFCSTSMSPAPPTQCDKCVKRNARDRIDEMDFSSKEKGKSNMSSIKDRYKYNVPLLNLNNSYRIQILHF